MISLAMTPFSGCFKNALYLFHFVFKRNLNVSVPNKKDAENGIRMIIDSIVSILLTTFQLRSLLIYSGFGRKENEKKIEAIFFLYILVLH